MYAEVDLNFMHTFADIWHIVEENIVNLEVHLVANNFGAPA